MKLNAKIILISLMLTLNINADCIVDYEVMYAVSSCESHKDRKIGYPYIISFNNRSDSAIAQSKLNLLWIDKRTVDCHDLNNCVKQLNNILEIGIENVDIGGFQINYKFHKYQVNKYFSLKDSYKIACTIIEKHYKEKGVWNWKTIARYHSKTPSLNNKYAKCLEKKYSNL